MMQHTESALKQKREREREREKERERGEIKKQRVDESERVDK